MSWSCSYFAVVLSLSQRPEWSCLAASSSLEWQVTEHSAFHLSKRQCLCPGIKNILKFYVTICKQESPSNSVQFSRSVVSNSLQPHGLQHARPPCPSPTPRACSNSCPSSRWCHPPISSSIVPFSSCPQSFPASESLPMNQFFASGGQILELQLQHQSFQ